MYKKLSIAVLTGALMLAGCGTATTNNKTGAGQNAKGMTTQAADQARRIGTNMNTELNRTMYKAKNNALGIGNQTGQAVNRAANRLGTAMDPNADGRYNVGKPRVGGVDGAAARGITNGMTGAGGTYGGYPNAGPRTFGITNSHSITSNPNDYLGSSAVQRGMNQSSNAANLQTQLTRLGAPNVRIMNLGNALIVGWNQQTVSQNDIRVRHGDVAGSAQGIAANQPGTLGMTGANIPRNYGNSPAAAQKSRIVHYLQQYGSGMPVLIVTNPKALQAMDRVEQNLSKPNGHKNIAKDLGVILSNAQAIDGQTANR